MEKRPIITSAKARLAENKYSFTIFDLLVVAKKIYRYFGF